MCPPTIPDLPGRSNAAGTAIYTVRAIPLIDEQHLHAADRDMPGCHDVEAISAENAVELFRKRLCVPADFDVVPVEPERKQGWLVTSYGYESVEILGSSIDTCHGLRLPIRSRGLEHWVHPFLVQRSAQAAADLHAKAAKRVRLGDFENLASAALACVRDTLRGAGD